MQIHRKKLEYRKNTTMYYFTKNRNECLCIEHDLTDDYGENDTSGANLKIQIHYQNSWDKKKLEKIKIEDVPKRVKDVLTYLETEIRTNICFSFDGMLNEPHAKCNKCGKYEWQHKNN